MTCSTNNLFFILELIFSLGTGLVETYLVTPIAPKYDLFLSVIFGFLTTSFFTLIGLYLIKSPLCLFRFCRQYYVVQLDLTKGFWRNENN